jgi:phage gp36-like protein
MTYATQSDMTDRFDEQEIIELTDRTGAGVVNATVLGKALADADALIDGYLAARYTLPLTYTPAILVGPAADIARFRLWDDRATEEVRQRYEDAMAMLKLISQGVVVLPPDVNGVLPVNAVGMDYYSQERVFTAETLEDF